MTRISVPPRLAVAAGVYHVGDGHARGENGDRVDLTPIWDELRESPGLEIECPKHEGTWWPTAGEAVPLSGLESWRCPTCAWTFREGLKGRGGSPRF